MNANSVKNLCISLYFLVVVFALAFSAREFLYDNAKVIILSLSGLIVFSYFFFLKTKTGASLVIRTLSKLS